MTLMITIFAAIAATMIWYTKPKARQLKAGMLCYMYWGASLMWMVDAIAEYIELRAAYFQPALEDMVNDAFLGVSVVALALVIWVVCVLVKDPLNVIVERIRSAASFSQ